jgi:tetratricopeptide (TPR) repeat protein
MEARACVVRGIWLSRQGKFAEAKAEYLRAVDFSPALAEAQNNLAHIHQMLGEREQARAALRKAWLLNPENEVVARNTQLMDSATDTGDGALNEIPLEIIAPGMETGAKTRSEPPPFLRDARWESINDSDVPPDSSARADAPHPAE